MIPLLYLWQGKLLYRTIGGVTGLATSAACCCGEVDGCCGRLVPGNGSLEGPEYYPLTLHVRITRGTCTNPATPVEFDLAWNPLMLIWENTAIGIPSIATTMRLNCETPNWSASLSGAICGCGGVGGSCTFDMVPTLTDGECNPVDLNGTAAMTGLMCCGNLGGGTVTIEVWE